MANIKGKNQYEDLTEKQRKFAEAYIELGHGTNAAKLAGYAENSAYSTASDLLKLSKIQEYMEFLREQRRSAMYAKLSGYAEEAVKMLYKLANEADSEAVRMQAVKDIMDRSGYKPTDKTENKNELSGKIEFGFTDPTQED